MGCSGKPLFWDMNMVAYSIYQLNEINPYANKYMVKMRHLCVLFPETPFISKLSGKNYSYFLSDWANSFGNLQQYHWACV